MRNEKLSLYIYDSGNYIIYYGYQERNILKREIMEVRFIDGPYKDEVLNLSNGTKKYIFYGIESDEAPLIIYHKPDSPVPSLKFVGYQYGIGKNEKGEYIGKMIGKRIRIKFVNGPLKSEIFYCIEGATKIKIPYKIGMIEYHIHQAKNGEWIGEMEENG